MSKKPLAGGGKMPSSQVRTQNVRRTLRTIRYGLAVDVLLSTAVNMRSITSDSHQGAWLLNVR